MELKMKKIIGNRDLFTATLSGLFLFFLSPIGHAEDIDIYTKPVTTGGPGGAPVVMFVLDTSGSMAWSIDKDENPNSLLKQRMFLLKDAALGQMTGMPGAYKVGIGRYHDNVTGKILSEAKSLGAGVGSFGLVGPQATTLAISAGGNDAEQYADGSAIRLAENVLDMSAQGSRLQRVGLRFTGLQIPAGAVVSKAYLQFRSTSNSSGTALSLTVGMDGSDAPAAFSSTDHLFARTVSWAAPQTLSGWSNGQNNAGTRLDVTGLIQNRLASPAWCDRGDVVFLVETSSTSNMRQAASHEGGNPARLVVEWELPEGANTCRNHEFSILSMSDDSYQKANGDIVNDGKFLGVNNQMAAGLRFGLLNIPPGAVVESARLDVTAHQSVAAPPALSILAFADPIARPLSTKKSSLAARPVRDTPVAWSPTAWVAGTRYASPDIGPLLQAVIDDPGWEYDGALGLLVRGSSSTELRIRAWERTDDDSTTTSLSKFGTFAAKLHVRARYPHRTTLTHRRWSVQTVAGMTATGGTPIAGAYLTAANYLLGNDPDFPTMPVLVSGDCGSNTLVILTDGAEQAYKYNTTTFPASVKQLTDKTCVVTPGGSTDWNRAWGCSKDIAKTMYEPQGTGATAMAEDGHYYSVKTYTIGFGPIAKTGGGELNAIAVQGGGDYFPATDSAALIDVFEQIVSSTTSAGTAVAAPGAAVNALNRYEHLDEIYYSLFKPSVTVNWRGNVKRYRLKAGDIVDVTGAGAIDRDESGFLPAAWSWWSPGEDGGDVISGGSASRLLPDSRKLLTWRGSYGTSMNAPLAVDEGAAAARDGSGAEVVRADNPHLDESLLGVNRLAGYAGMTASERQAARDQAIVMLRGGTDSVSEKGYGASIHASPLLVSFGTDDKGTDNRDDDELLNTVFVGDSTGVLHMIDTGGPSADSVSVNKANAGGTELFAFIPQELLNNGALLAENKQKVKSLGGEYIHGLDGQWTVWRNDLDRDGNIDVGGGEGVYIFGGMRRGGQNVYALDVSTVHRNSASPAPRLLWVVEGGKPGPYANMGQTWSMPRSHWVKWDGERRRVVFFGGGYDPDLHDAVQSYSAVPHKGRQIYMLDAITGQLLWWASSEAGASTTVPSMTHSITATPVVMDRNGNGTVDGMYVVDLAGQVMRFDFNESATGAANFVRGGAPVLVATLGATAPLADDALDNRRFYDAPAVSYVRSATGGDLLIGLVSGYREVPTDMQTQEIALVVRDRGAWSIAPAPAPAVLTLADLADVSFLDELGAAEAASGKGWYLLLDKANGEKGMGTPTFFNFALLFSTYVPYGSGLVSECSPDIGRSRLYVLNALTAGGLVNDGLDHVSLDQRYLDHVVPGISPAPQLLLVGGVLTAFTGPNAIATDILERAESRRLTPDALNAIDRTRWYQIRN